MAKRRRQKPAGKQNKRMPLKAKVDLAIAGVAVIGVLAGGYVYVNRHVSGPQQQTRQQAQALHSDGEATLEKVKLTGDAELGQAYIDKLVKSGKMPFQKSLVVYDPDFSRTYDFLSYLASTKPGMIDLINRARINTDSIKASPGPGFNYTIMQTVNIGETRVFVYRTTNSETDNDVLWALEHERCHAEIDSPAYEVTVPATNEAVSAVRALKFYPPFEESRCYTHQFRVEPRFNPSRNMYNATVSQYRTVYTQMTTYADQNRILVPAVRELFEGPFINPYNLPIR